MYAEEDISTNGLTYTSNEPLLDLFLMRHKGLFDLLNEESFFPNGSPSNFCGKLKEQWQASPELLASSKVGGFPHHASILWAT